MAKKTIFLDLYGTILYSGNFGVSMAKLGITYFLKPKFLNNAIKGLEIMAKDSNLVLISNQGGINFGIISDKNFRLLLDRFDKLLKNKGINFAGLYYCPHMESDKCACRKPEIGMLEHAINELNLDLSNSWFIGDQTCDILTGKRAGCKTILLETGYAGKDSKFNAVPDYKSKDLYEAVTIINKDNN